MLEIFGAIAGFAGSAIPQILGFFKDRLDKKHELNIRELEARTGIEISKDKADTAETQEIYKTFYSGIKWVDALNGTVRPVITYLFFALYSYTKICYVIEADPFIMSEFWTPVDNTIFLTIISYFFGQRAMQKVK
jgi:hypothetical protein